MNRVVIKSKVDSNGVLQLTLPLGLPDAGREVQITIEPAGPPAMSQEEWRRAILATSGKWQGDFERPEQGELEEREQLS
jgi:hypothetical protein